MLFCVLYFAYKDDPFPVYISEIYRTDVSLLYKTGFLLQEAGLCNDLETI
jgi:hypothetical protein